MELESAFIYVLLAATSALMICLGVMRFGLKMDTLGNVLREISECVGASVVFFAINAGLGVTVVFLVRGAFAFLSLYAVTELMLVFLSAVQGFVFQLWWRRSRNWEANDR